jgi:hypothetical protein
MGDRPADQPPAFSGKNPVSWVLSEYRSPGIIHDARGRPTFADSPTYDRDGKPIANSAGQPYAVDRGASRAIQLYGTRQARDSLEPIFVDAGNLLSSMRADSLSVPIPSPTLRTDKPLARWLYFLFDMAWAEVAGSPLRVSREKSAWYQNTDVTLKMVLWFRGPNKPAGFHPAEPMIANIPDPPNWYSVIDDLAQASVDAIDILLAEVMTREEGVENRDLPRFTDEHVLQTLRNMAVHMERNPATFAFLSEEEIRDHFLLQLNGQFKGNAFGEVRNGRGKTDILIRLENQHVLIAECKFWDGPSKFDETIDQLLGYLTWRDCRAALLVFNRTKNTTSVAEKMDAVMQQRVEYRGTIAHDAQGQSRYIFVKADDRDNKILISTLLFDIPAG